jgi:pimeloyl-ACP methyl ester carboxylesterase
MAPLRNAQPLLAALPQVTTIRLDDTGHALMAERPGEVLDALRPFA